MISDHQPDLFAVVPPLRTHRERHISERDCRQQPDEPSQRRHGREESAADHIAMTNIFCDHNLMMIDTSHNMIDPAQNFARLMRPSKLVNSQPQSILPPCSASRIQSRNSSLIEVLARVFSSTRLTITAQYRLGPVSFPSAFPGMLPDTTTE